MRYVIKINMVILTILVLMIVVVRKSMASCLDPTDCYCTLGANERNALVGAEIVDIDNDLVDMRIVGVPYYDSTEKIISGEILYDMPCPLSRPDCSSMEVGMKGLFNIGVVQPSIGSFIIEKNDLLPCDLDADFRGATMEEVADAVLSDNCHNAAIDLGVKGPDCIVTEGCCSRTEAMNYISTYMIIMGISIYRRKHRK